MREGDVSCDGTRFMTRGVFRVYVRDTVDGMEELGSRSLSSDDSFENNVSTPQWTKRI